MREAQSPPGPYGAGDRPKRIAGVLLWLAGQFGPTSPFTRQSIAEMANTTQVHHPHAHRFPLDADLIATGWKAHRHAEFQGAA